MRDCAPIRDCTGFVSNVKESRGAGNTPTRRESCSCAAKFETKWLDLLSTQNPIQTKLLGLLYGVVIVHWLQEDDLNKTLAFLDRVLNAVPISSIL